MEYLAPRDRATYEAAQLSRSGKFSYCKTSIHDVEKYVAIINADRRRRDDTKSPPGPVLCLGVRNGREVDLWRIALRGSRIHRAAVRCFERRWHGFNTRWPWLERIGRNDVHQRSPTACLGVELSPACQRADVWIGSYDALPLEWSGQFGVIFSNAFDHACDPHVTAVEWRRVLRAGGYLVLDFPAEQSASMIAPVGTLTAEDVRTLFPGTMVAYHPHGSARDYTTHIVRMA